MLGHPDNRYLDKNLYTANGSLSVRRFLGTFSVIQQNHAAEFKPLMSASCSEVRT